MEGDVGKNLIMIAVALAGTAMFSFGVLFASAVMAPTYRKIIETAADSANAYRTFIPRDEVSTQTAVVKGVDIATQTPVNIREVTSPIDYLPNVEIQRHTKEEKIKDAGIVPESGSKDSIVEIASCEDVERNSEGSRIFNIGVDSFKGLPPDIPSGPNGPDLSFILLIIVLSGVGL